LLVERVLSIAGREGVRCLVAYRALGRSPRKRAGATALPSTPSPRGFSTGSSRWPP